MRGGRRGHHFRVVDHNVWLQGKNMFCCGLPDTGEQRLDDGKIAQHCGEWGHTLISDNAGHRTRQGKIGIRCRRVILNIRSVGKKYVVTGGGGFQRESPEGLIVPTGPHCRQNYSHVQIV